MSALAMRWRRWRFHLSALVLIVPLGFAPGYFKQLSLEDGSAGLGERMIGVQRLGRWKATLAEFVVGPPVAEGPAGPIKTFSLALGGAAVDDVKAAYLKIGKPRSIRSAGALFEGAPYNQTAGVAIPADANGDSEVWLTLEGWDGSIEQTSLPLSEASPSTTAWLAARAN
ncbi:MAG: thiamine pyrophosphate-binding protein [Hansschlegelia sp.]